VFQSFCIIHPLISTRQKYITDFLSQHKIAAVDVLNLPQDAPTIVEIRKSLLFLSRKPFASSHIALVIVMDALSVEAQQTLLKTLEEPPAHSFIILSVKTAEIVLPTIISRSHLIELKDFPGLELSQKETTECQQFWQRMFASSIGERFKETLILTKDRDESIVWLEKQITYFTQYLKQVYHQSIILLSPIATVFMLRLLLKTRELIKQNVSLKLAVDHLFIRLPKITV